MVNISGKTALEEVSLLQFEVCWFSMSIGWIQFLISGGRNAKLLAS